MRVGPGLARDGTKLGYSNRATSLPQGGTGRAHSGNGAPTMIPILALTLLAAPSQDWPQLTGPLGDRTLPASLEASNLAGAGVSWRVETPGGFSSFAVAGGRALTLVSRDVEGDLHEVLVALDAKTGREAWAATLGTASYDGGGNAGAGDNKGGDGPRTTPVVAGGRVYVYDAHLVVWCLDLGSGEPLWRRDLLAENEGRQIRWQNATAPVVVGTTVLVAGGGAGQTMLGLDAETGAVRWGQGDDHMTHATPTPAEIHGVEQVIFFLRGGLTSVLPEDGTVLWSFEYPFSVSSAASPVVWEDHVYVSAGYGVGAGVWRIDRSEDGSFAPEFIWRKRNKLQNHWSTPACKDGYLYGMFSFKKYGTGPLKCVHLATGEEKWSVDGFGPGNVILTGDQVVALSDTGEVVVAEATPEGYGELWRNAAVEGKCWSSPALAGGALYVRSTREGVRLDLSGK